MVQGPRQSGEQGLRRRLPGRVRASAVALCEPGLRHREPDRCRRWPRPMSPMRTPSARRCAEADFDSVRGDFEFAPNHHPIQDIYVREVVKEGDVVDQQDRRRRAGRPFRRLRRRLQDVIARRRPARRFDAVRPSDRPDLLSHVADASHRTGSERPAVRRHAVPDGRRADAGVRRHGPDQPGARLAVHGRRLRLRCGRRADRLLLARPRGGARGRGGGRRASSRSW